MKNRAGLLFSVAIFAAVVIVALSRDSMVAGYPYKPNMAEAVASTLAALIAVALVVERGMALVNAILFGDEQRDAEIKLTNPKVPAASAVTALSNVLSDKERLRLFGAFVAGLFISAAGVRTLEGLLDTRAQGAAQNTLLIPVDIVLTAALIAGGSNGLAFLLQIAKDRLANPPPAQVAAPVAGPKGEAVITANSTPNSSIRARLITTG